MIKTKFLGGEVPREGIYYGCAACLTIGSIIGSIFYS